MAPVTSSSVMRPICAAVLFLALAACSKLESGQGEMSWARDALGRNDRLEVVATDPQANTFTVRLKDTGELRVLRADQIVAGPPSVASAPPEPPVAASPGVAPAEVAPAPPVAQTAPVTPPPSAPEDASTAATHSAASADEAARPLDAQPEAEPAAAPGVRSEAASGANPGHLLASGPGYTIKAGDSKGAAPVRRIAATVGGAVERHHDPIICQGDRFLQIDNRNLEFDGDAVTAEDGCEIHITNSRITAKGVGLFARKANVHIENSQIEGDTSSVDASEGAQVYVASSTFRGLRRRMDDAAFHDLGGNVWN